MHGEARKQVVTLEMAVKAVITRALWLGMERQEAAMQQEGRPGQRGERSRESEPS
jgi:hypothetical protein